MIPPSSFWGRPFLCFQRQRMPAIQERSVHTSRVIIGLQYPGTTARWHRLVAFSTRRFASGGRQNRSPRGSRDKGSAQGQRRLQKGRHKKRTSKNNRDESTTESRVGEGKRAVDEQSQKHVPWREDPAKYKDYQKYKYTAMAQRAAPLVVFGLLINMTDEGSNFFHNYIFPLQIEQLYGPSMVPTIHPYGDAWLHTTSMWDSLRSIFHKLKSLVFQTPSLMYERGEIVIWRDPETDRRACKRIVGVEGDTVQRYGQFAEYYAHRADVGVPWDAGLGSRGLDPSCPWDKQQDQGTNAVFSEENHSTNEGNISEQLKEGGIYRTLVVPEGHVWLEGDNPLLSVDSRHYGPIPVAYLEGRLVWRLWPLLRHPVIRKHDQLLLRHRAIRPQPLDLETPKQRGQEDRLAVYYNLHRRRPLASDSEGGEKAPVAGTE